VTPAGVLRGSPTVASTRMTEQLTPHVSTDASGTLITWVERGVGRLVDGGAGRVFDVWGTRVNRMGVVTSPSSFSLIAANTPGLGVDRVTGQAFDGTSPWNPATLPARVLGKLLSMNGTVIQPQGTPVALGSNGQWNVTAAMGTGSGHCGFSRATRE
jgi:hypothetical protein